MKNIFITVMLALLVGTIGYGPAMAQDDGFKIVPVEMYACTFNDRKGPADLDRWATKWNEWADSQGIDDYAAWTLTPFYYGPGENAGLDVIWMGAGKSGAALGAAQDAWLSTNDGLNDEVLEIMTCGSHGNFASAILKMPPQNETPANSVLTFSDCKLKHGATNATVGQATTEWGQHLSDGGSTAGIWHFFPAYGGGGETYDFKRLIAYENLTQLGEDYDRYTTGRGFVKRNQLLGHLVDCDASRAYIAQSRRIAQLR